MKLSVIIPSHNRMMVLCQALDSLRTQSFRTDEFEVIVVDDGSTDGTMTLRDQVLPFSFRILRTQNQGATAARNFGTRASNGATLVFMDDDVVLYSHALEMLAAICSDKDDFIALGCMFQTAPSGKSIFSKITSAQCWSSAPALTGTEVHFTKCNTQLLAIRRDSFLRMGMFHDPGGGWPNWDDVDFGYRAHSRGIRLFYTAAMAGEHRDYAMLDLAAASRRWHKAASSSVRLFQKHSGLLPELPMFQDKRQIVWTKDCVLLIARKVARNITAARPVLNGLELLVRILEKVSPKAYLLRPLYRWVLGGHQTRGFREGLAAHGQIGDKPGRTVEA